MTISDNGVGFDVAAALCEHVDGRKLGLRSMRERIRAAGGDLVISSAPGEGTTLLFWCPSPPGEPTLTRRTEEALAVAGH